MQTLSPPAGRIGAALKALRQAHGQESQSESALSFGTKCLRAVTAQLADEGLPKEDLQPLIDLEARLREIVAQMEGKGGANRRKGRAPSDILLARAAAVIDLLIKSGSDEAEAAQICMRRLMAAGVPPPQQGGDARGWKRLLEWRVLLSRKLVSSEALQEYLDFTSGIEAIPAQERVKRVLDEGLWDRRRRQR